MLAIATAVVICAVFALVSTIDTGDRVVSPLSYPFGIASALLLAFRRVRPVLTVAAVVLLVFFFVVVIGSDPGPIGAPIWIGLYTVAVMGDRRRSIGVAASVAVIVSVLTLLAGPESPTVLERIAAVGLTLVPILIGDAVRSRRALIADAEERVRLAEEAAEQEALRQVQDERVRIARELHDVVAHSIATINVQSGVAAHVIDADPDAARDALVEIKRSSKSAMAELRAMLGVLRDEDDDETPLEPSPDIDDVEALVDRFAGAASLTVDGRPAHLVDPAIGLVAYRVVQEGLTNTLKHAADAIVDVHLAYGDDSIRIEVSDDGDISTTKRTEPGGLGLIGLNERVRAVGGSFVAEPRFGGGFDVRAELPYAPAVAT